VRFLVTGSAGFIGFHLSRRLLDEGHEVVGIDGLTPYYAVDLKLRRHAILLQRERFTEEQLMLTDIDALSRVWSQGNFDVVIHLAAQVGVRFSVDFPDQYVDSNLVGTFNVLELLRRRPVKHFMLASSSSVYGSNLRTPFCENDTTDHPLTIYAATKRATELMAHSYSHLWGIPTTVLRFFSVYGPWARPDLAVCKFTRSVIEGTPIDLNNSGRMERDFTYIDDLSEAVIRLVPCVPSRNTAWAEADSQSPVAPFRVVNIGSGRPVGLLAFLAEIEKNVGKESIRRLLPMRSGEALATHADVNLLEKLTGFKPSTPLATGIKTFIAWYRSYYCVQ
jgi:UDP-glucuronate 4-epimerase